MRARPPWLVVQILPWVGGLFERRDTVVDTLVAAASRATPREPAWGRRHQKPPFGLYVLFLC